jgi:hypothetical protein
MLSNLRIIRKENIRTDLDLITISAFREIGTVELYRGHPSSPGVPKLL